MGRSRRKYKKSRAKVRVGLPKKKPGIFKPAVAIPANLPTPSGRWDNEGYFLQNYRSFGVVANPNLLGVRVRTPHIVQTRDLQVPHDHQRQEEAEGRLPAVDGEADGQEDLESDVYPRKEKEHQVAEMVIEKPISKPPGSSIKHMDMAGNVGAEVGSSCPQKEILDSNIQLTLEKDKVSPSLQNLNVASISEGTSSNMVTTPILQDDALAKETHNELQVSSPTSTLPLPGASTPAEQSGFRDTSQSHIPTQRLSSSSDGESSCNFSVSYIKTHVLSSASGGSSSSQLLLQLRESMVPAGRKIIKDFLASIHALDVLPTPDVFGEGVNRISEALTFLSLPTEAWVNFAKGIEEKLASIHEQESRMADNVLRESTAKELEEAKAAYNDAFSNHQKAVAEIFARDTQICSLQQKIKEVENERVHWINVRDTSAHVQELSRQRTSDIELVLENLKLEEEKLHTDIATLKKELYSDIMNNENISFL